MSVAVAAIGVAAGILGAVGVVSPAMLAPALDGLKSSPRKIYGLAVVRVVIGVVLIAGAPSTAFPTLILFIGAAYILRAAAIPLLGLTRVRSRIEWLQGRSALFMRCCYLAVVTFGAFLAWAAIKQ